MADDDERLEIEERVTVVPDADVPEEIEERLRDEDEDDGVEVTGL